MAFTLDDLLEGLRNSRKFFFKHLEGLKQEQWDWKPYPECKSIRETLIHLIVDDRAAIESLNTNKEPDYLGLSDATFAAAPADLAQIRALLDESHAELLALIQSRYRDAPLDAEINVFGTNMKLGNGVPYLSIEDCYHAGQVAYIRMASDPSWDYYAALYGG